MARMKILMVVFALLVPLSTHGALLRVDSSGQLTGATDISVDGALWDVEFSDGAWDFSSGAGLPATTKAEADLFSQALLDQVLLDTALGTFDSDPETANGCENLNACIFWTPYFVDGVNTYFSLAFNQRSGGVNPDMVRDIPGILGLTGNFATDTTWTLGVWTRSSSNPPPVNVPEPGTLGLLAAGLFGMVFMRRKQAA